MCSSQHSPLRRQSRIRPPDTISWLLILSLFLFFSLLPSVFAQSTISGSTHSFSSGGGSSSSSSSGSSIPSANNGSSSSASSFRSSRASSLASSSTSSASPSSTPSISISGLPFTNILPPLNSTSPSLLLNLPTVSTLFITLNICQLGSNSSLLPTVLVSTASPPIFSLGSRSTAQASSGGIESTGYNLRSRAATTWAVSWGQGYGNWTWTGNGNVGVSVLISLAVDQNGAIMGPIANGNVVVQLSASTSNYGAMVSPSIPLLGDTTSSTSLIFSPLLASSPIPQPTYPNYTLPGISLSYPDTNMTNSTSDFGPSPNLSLIIVPTSSAPINTSFSLCAILSANTSSGGIGENNIVVSSDGQWTSIGGEQGVRAWWVVEGLQPETNYTTWIVDTHNKVISSPTFFYTKEVLPTPMCPSISYAAALPSNGTYPISVFPDDVNSNITSNLQSFSTSLLSQACGRDFYSHVSSCLDCYSAYRDWLCRILVPQCASSITPTLSSSANSSTDSISPPQPSTINRTPDSPRNPGLPTASYDYTELLPCLGVCNTVVRVCPVFLGFVCPGRSVNANQSYAFVGGADEMGSGLDSTWPALDAWGNRWCNG